MHFSLISTFTVVAVMAGLSIALPVSTTIDSRNAVPEEEGNGGGLTIPITIGLPISCLGIAVCNPVTAEEESK
ncbi:hypothetical protein SS1G_13910 [Sclerotinia sclerotiorum 1980 UF-70]|uniref:Uncharacterized protein n=2 Tax=Sclerotinia sclerotiorum (strain ATCC 18683 / 1980 / Ss-1) TaxID=665079 RepID=A7F8H9_SCLS1|nr:hypothetical protein SS1G_13910 [Sclerotinia sclerotiorum 1980 UF-70]APA13816.1 hypothetical protein sscle_11g085860 [Sclerotinia sclerotiorum 1980 UF-70]EDN99050.1 hypothetical protein SS1G_13910 [Sclerotinia sclerotiorum 1980 UF-70]